MSKKTIKDFTAKQTPLSYEFVMKNLGSLEGKVLTIIDASFTNSTQSKAVKDLVRKMFSEQRAWIGQIAFPDVVMMSREQVNETVGDVEQIEANADQTV